MHEVYIFNRSFELIGIIDAYVSLIWRPSYSDIGDFELYLGAQNAAVELLKENYYLVRVRDIEADESGKIKLKKVMIIKNIGINTDVENGDFLTVTGRELKFILHQRLIWTQTIINGTAEQAIRQYITENAINPTDKNRIIPGLELASPAGFTDEISKQVTAKPLDETIVEICNTYGFGWDVYVYDNKMIFELYKGIDRSYGQTERPYVVFSEDFNNLYNSEYQKNTESFANTALIGGEGEGLERKYATVGDENTGLDRFEIFVEASSVKQNDGKEAEQMSDKEYNAALQQNGREKLAEYAITEAFTGEAVTDINFVYEKDFFLGDIVTVINKYGITRNAKVISAIESVDDTGEKLIPIFNL